MNDNAAGGDMTGSVTGRDIDRAPREGDIDSDVAEDDNSGDVAEGDNSGDVAEGDINGGGIDGGVVEVPPADERARVERVGGVGSVLGGRLAPLRGLGLVGVLVVLGVVGVVTTNGRFLTGGNIVNILTSSSIVGVVTVGMTFVIIGGGIDLSVGALVALSSVWATTVATQSYGPVVMVLCAVLVGVGSGLFNGILIAYGRLVPFIVTLGMMVAARGLAQSLSDRKTQLVTVPSINGIASGELFGVPALVYIFVGVVAVGWVVLNRTTFGRRTFAVGGNPEAARLAGIDVRLHTTALYVVSGLCCGLAAIMIMALTTTGSSTHGDLYELDAIAAVIIGGTLLTGGRGTLIGSILGVLVFTTITNLFVLNNLPTEVQNIAKGLIIFAAVLLQRRSRSSTG